MVNRNKSKGTKHETDTVNYLQDHGVWAARKVQHSMQDDGDINVGPDVITLQAKDWANLVSALSEGVHGAEVQASRAGTRWGWAVIKRRRKPVGENYVAFTLRQARELAAFIIEHQDCS